MLALLARQLLLRGQDSASSVVEFIQLCEELSTGSAVSCRSTAQQLCPTLMRPSDNLHMMPNAAHGLNFQSGGGSAHGSLACHKHEIVTVTLGPSHAPSSRLQEWTTDTAEPAAAPRSTPELRACIEDGGKLAASATPHALEAWAESAEAEACRTLLDERFAELEEQVAATSTRRARNEMLQRVVAEWGEPASVGMLLLLCGCDVSDSYDEFLSCTIVPSRSSRLLLDVNVYSRSPRLDGGAWRCTTCTFHRHARWWASKVVVGSIVHTLAQPTCPRPEERPSAARAALPTFAELDANLSTAPASGTPIDVVGSRWRAVAPQHTVWTTTEVLPVHAGSIVTFPPNWYHRVVPPAADAPTAAVTLRAQWLADSAFWSGETVLDDEAAHHVPTSRGGVCFTRWDLIHALRRPDVDRAHGIPTPPCTIDAAPFAAMRDARTLATPTFATPPFERPRPQRQAPTGSWPHPARILGTTALALGLPLLVVRRTEVFRLLEELGS